MIQHLRDWPNVITVFGLILTTIAFGLIARGAHQLATVVLMWAVMLDHLDGYVARKLAGRRNPNSALVGADLDSLTDFASGVLAPMLISVMLNQGSLLSLASAVVFTVLAALRVSCFNNFGYAPSGRFHGVPLTYNVPAVALLLATDAIWNLAIGAVVLPALLVVLGVLHVVRFGPPPLSGWGYALASAYAVGLTVVWGFS